MIAPGKYHKPWYGQMKKEKKDAEQKAREAEEKRIEEGYGSVDEDEKATIDKKQVLSNPG